MRKQLRVMRTRYCQVSNMKDNNNVEDLITIPEAIKKTDDLQKALQNIACGSNGHNPINDKPYVFIHAYINKAQTELLPLETDIEHIFPKSWVKQAKANGVAGMHEGDTDGYGKQFVEYFGNKVCLEKLNNIKCSDNYFADKLKIYEEGTPATEKSVGVTKSNIHDVIDFYTKRKEGSEHPQWGKEDIVTRDKEFANDLLCFFKNNIKFSN